MAFVYTYNWDSNLNDASWLWSNPTGTTTLYTNQTRRSWNRHTGDTGSVGVGPTSGVLASTGYLYTEASSATVANDVFTMELGFSLDTASNDVVVSFYTNQRGTWNTATCLFQTNENSAGWVTRGSYGGASDPFKVATNGVDIWTPRTVNLAGVVNSTLTRIRIVITMPNTSNIWHNDYGIDAITIVGVDKITLQTHQMII